MKNVLYINSYIYILHIIEDNLSNYNSICNKLYNVNKKYNNYKR